LGGTARLASAALLGLAACSSPDPFPVSGGGTNGGTAQAGTGPVESKTPISPDDFFAREARALCGRWFRCLSPRDDDMSLRFLFGTTAVCEAEVARYNARSPNVADLRQKLAAGDLTVSADATESCLEELASCGEADALNEGSCREVFEGAVAQGGACQRDEDCSGNSYCAGDSCPGQCQPRGLPGAACTGPTQCAYWGSPVFCDTTGGTLPGTCRELDRSAKAGPGEKCTRSFRTAQQAFFQCQDDLWCAPPTADDDTGLGHCEKPSKVRELAAIKTTCAWSDFVTSRTDIANPTRSRVKRVQPAATRRCRSAIRSRGSAARTTRRAAFANNKVTAPKAACASAVTFNGAAR
jgi:hypothetical protein